MEELTDAEREMLERAAFYKEDRLKNREDKKKKVKFFLRPVFWAFVLLPIPVIITVLVMITSSQIDISLSSDAVEYVPNLGEEISTQFGPLLEARMAILGVTWTIYILIALILVVVDILISRKRKPVKKEQL